MSEFQLEHVPVEFGEERLSGDLKISQDDSGHLGLCITTSERKYRGDVPVNSVATFVPVVKIAPAFYSGSYGNSDKALIKVVAPEVEIINELNITPTQIVTVRYVLAGQRKLVLTGNPVVLDGRNWIFNTVGDFGWEGRAIEDASDYVPLDLALVTEKLPYQDLESTLASVRKILTCMTFALGGVVSLARIEVISSEGRLLKTVLRDVIRPERMMSAPIHVFHLTQFIQWAYPRLDELESKFRITSVIRLLAWARNQHVLELKALNLAGVLELFRYQYAKNYLVPEGKAKEKGDLFIRPVSNRPWRFEEIHVALTKKFRITGWKKHFTKFRNSVIHSGTVPGTGMKEQDQAIMDVLHYCDTVVLALLDWDECDGEYVPCYTDPTSTSVIRGYQSVKFMRLPVCQGHKEVVAD